MKLLLYLNTIKYLKLEQIFYQIFYRLIKPVPAHHKYIIKIRDKKNKFSEISRKSISLIDQNTLEFFGKSISLLDNGWNTKKQDQLFLYNLNYFDDLNAENFKQRSEWHKIILKSWLNENQYDQKNVAWEPYPTSVRSINWIKWSLFDNTFTEKYLVCLYYHGMYLEKNLERNILGNHFFTNAKALIYLGLYFNTIDSDRWFKKGLKIIGIQIREQVLDDGGNFELSPSYHVNFLEDILDIINILNTYNNDLYYSKDFILELKLTAKRMIEWLHAIVWYDGSLPSFNDSANNTGVSYKKIISYAKRLGIQVNNKNVFNKLTYKHLKDSGYLIIFQNNNKIILDIGKIGPEYLTAHSHADTLSFEMEVANQKLLVNSGTSCYGISNRRHFERSTRAHNTVEISNKNSSQVWSGFRVAKRAFPKNLNIKESNNSINISCSHDGYSSFFKKCIHNRTWIINKNKIIIKDNIIGKKTSAVGRFIFHNDVKITSSIKNEYIMTLVNKIEMRLILKKGKSKLIKWKCTDIMGNTKNTNCLEVTLENNQSLVEIIYK